MATNNMNMQNYLSILDYIDLYFSIFLDLSNRFHLQSINSVLYIICVLSTLSSGQYGPESTILYHIHFISITLETGSEYYYFILFTQSFQYFYSIWSHIDSHHYHLVLVQFYFQFYITFHPFIR